MYTNVRDREEPSVLHVTAKGQSCQPGSVNQSLQSRNESGVSVESV